MTQNPIIKDILFDNILQYGKSFVEMARDVATDVLNGEDKLTQDDIKEQINTKTSELVDLILYVVEHEELP